MLEIEEMLIEHERLRLKVYTCPAGKITIGVGRNLQDRGITKNEVMLLLKNDITYFDFELKNRFPWFTELSRNRQNILIDMAFNLGIAGLLKFKKTLKYIEMCDYVSASQEMLKSKWAKQVGFRALELSEMLELDISFKESKF